MKNYTKRNGKIEFLRFIFCLIILLFHLNKDFYEQKLMICDSVSFFAKGHLAVEFFFVLSGFLLAKVAFFSAEENKSLGSDTVLYLKKKIIAILPVHIICFALTFIPFCLKNHISPTGVPSLLLKLLPNFLMLNKTGILCVEGFNDHEWYIGIMLLMTIIIYPLCKKYQKSFTNIFAPVVSIIIVGYILYNYKGLGITSDWMIVTFKCNFRAFADMCLGTVCYSVCNKISESDFSKRGKIILTSIEIFSFCMCVFLTCLDWSSKNEGLFLIFLVILISLVFSNQTYFNSIFLNKYIAYLGKLSLPIYIVQGATRLVAKMFMGQFSSKLMMVITFVFTVIAGMVVLELSKPLGKIIKTKTDKICTT